MQQQLYEDAPYIVTAYTGVGEAFRNDTFACFQPQPDPGGVWLIQYGGRNYNLLRPAAEAGDCDGTPTAVGAVTDGASGPAAGSADRQRRQHHGRLPGRRCSRRCVLVAGAWMLQRRRTVDDRE